MASNAKDSSVDYLQKVKHKGIRIKTPCPACGDTADKTLYFKVRERAESPTLLDICRCDQCDSYFCHPLEVRSYESNMTERFINFYIEICGGVQSMLNALVRVPASKRSNMLEIGCGYGFSLDIWRFLNKTPAVGVEPSSYANRGAKELGADIKHGILKKESGAGVDVGKPGSFDTVVSFEVIEHVTDQAAFIDLASHYLKPDGVLLLSTPNALKLDIPSSSDYDMVQVLSPGHHTTVLSQKALSKLLKNAGFEHQYHLGTEYQQIVCASRVPLELENPGLIEQQEIYQAYLIDLKTRAKKSDSSSLFLGALFRLFENYTNTGNLERAAKVQEELESALKGTYKFYQHPVNDAVSSILKTWGDTRFINRLPHFAIPMEYYRAMVALLHTKDEEKALQHLQAVLDLTPRSLKVLPHLSAIVTPLLWRVRVELTKINFKHHGPRRTEALKELKRLRKEGSDAPDSWKQAASIERLKLLMSLIRLREADEELTWLEQWFGNQLGLKNGDSIITNPHHLAEVGLTSIQELYHYLWYLLLRGQLALQASQQQSSISSRGQDYGIKSLIAGEQLATRLLQSPDQESIAKFFLPLILETLAESYKDKQEYRQARHVLHKKLQLASRFNLNAQDKDGGIKKVKRAILSLYVEENFDSLWESQMLEIKQQDAAAN